MTDTINSAAAKCRAAWKKHPKARWAWCCHHDMRLELLTEPAENRIQYILENKLMVEQITRLNNFRPVLSKLPAELDKARAEWDKARAELDKASAELVKARAEFLNSSQCERAHRKDVPDHTWNGKSIFNESPTHHRHAGRARI